MAKIIGLVSLVGAIAVLVYFCIRISKIVKAHTPGKEKYVIEGRERTETLILAVLVGLFLAVGGICVPLAEEYSLKFYEYILIILGSTIFGVALTAGVGGFWLYYYKTDLDEKQRGVCKLLWPIAGVILLYGLLIFTEGIANHIMYPLVNGVSFSEGWIRPFELNEGFSVRWYGILIVSGALLCYAITDHEIFKKYGRKGLIDTLFVLAFISGIIGARLWYTCVLEPEYFFKNRPSWMGPLYFLTGITDGGLAVQGGVILGIIVAVIYMRTFRKYINLRYLLDVAVPTILLAQVIGRWGNFFNQEVYGAVVDPKALWFLPTIVKNNMEIDGLYRIPLFFIEGCMNLAGYFVIRYGLGKGFKCKKGLGYQASSYLIWYGMVRAVLELLRDPEFRYVKSWYVAFGMMLAGAILFVAAYFWHKYRLQNGVEDENGDKIQEA